MASLILPILNSTVWAGATNEPTLDRRGQLGVLYGIGAVLIAMVYSEIGRASCRERVVVGGVAGRRRGEGQVGCGTRRAGRTRVAAARHPHRHGFFFQAEDGIRAFHVTGVQTCALPISMASLILPILNSTVWAGATNEPTLDRWGQLGVLYGIGAVLIAMVYS